MSKRILLTDKSSSLEGSSGDVFQILFTEKRTDKHFSSVGLKTTKLDVIPFFTEIMFDKNGRHCRTLDKFADVFGSRFGEVKR